MLKASCVDQISLSRLKRSSRHLKPAQTLTAFLQAETKKLARFQKSQSHQTTPDYVPMAQPNMMGWAIVSHNLVDLSVILILLCMILVSLYHILLKQHWERRVSCMWYTTARWFLCIKPVLFLWVTISLCACRSVMFLTMVEGTGSVCANRGKSWMEVYRQYLFPQLELFFWILRAKSQQLHQLFTITFRHRWSHHLRRGNLPD